VIGTAILCSGQGGQNAAMFATLSEAPETQPVFEAAKRALGGTDPRDLVQQASDADIHANFAGQILCCTQTMATWAVIDAHIERPLLVAGYSVGELAAWGVAGLIDAATVLDLARQRADCMDTATREPSGLAAIRGLSRAALQNLCDANDSGIAIVNGADQMLVGGTLAKLTPLMQQALANGAARAALLPVAVASHTKLLAAAAETFRQALANAPIRPSLTSGMRLLSGIDGEAVFDVARGADKLARQIRQTVQWSACMDAVRAAGVRKVIELGPGHALVGMIRETVPEVDAHSVSEFRSLDGFLRWVRRE
jgi:[acyl-carrier-protein] S-malonyltransferase